MRPPLLSTRVDYHPSISAILGFGCAQEAQACSYELNPPVIMIASILGGGAFAFSLSETYGNGLTTTLFRNETSVPSEVLTLNGSFYAFAPAESRQPGEYELLVDAEGVRLSQIVSVRAATEYGLDVDYNTSIDEFNVCAALHRKADAPIPVGAATRVGLSETNTRGWLALN